MADYVTKVRTERGDLQIDYEALANLPKSDTTLTQSGAFADAQVTGDKIAAAQSTADSAVEAAAKAQSTADEALSKSGVTSVNTEKGDVFVDAFYDDNGNQILYGYHNDDGDVTLQATNADGESSSCILKDNTIYTGDGKRVYDESHIPSSSVIKTDGSEGQILAVNASGTISPNEITIADLIIKSMFELQDKTLYITTNV